MRKTLSRTEIVDLIIDAYQGTNTKGAREFMWEREDGNVVIGNTRAFADFLGRKFGVAVTPESAHSIHSILRRLGEVTKPYEKRGGHTASQYRTPEPQERIVQRGRR